MIKQDWLKMHFLTDWSIDRAAHKSKKNLIEQKLSFCLLLNGAGRNFKSAQSFIRFGRPNLRKMWDRRVSSHFLGGLRPRFPLRWVFTMVGRPARLAKCFSQPSLLCQPYFIKEANLSAHQNFWQIKLPHIPISIHVKVWVFNTNLCSTNK